MAGIQNILDRLCGLQGSNFTITDVKVREQEHLYRVEHIEEAKHICPRCERVTDSAHDFRWVRLRDVPMGAIKQVWEVKRARILCCCSTQPIVEKMPFRSKHHRLTKRLEDYIEQVLCSKMFTVADVARLFELDYGVIYKIDHDVLFRLWQELEVPDPENIAVDEKSFKRGHSYVTIVTDVDRKQVIWVSEGNRKDSLDQFFKVLGKERCAKIKTVSKDLHVPYMASCREHIPQATEVADKFHVVKRLNDAIDGSRKELAVGSTLKVSKRRLINNLQWVMRYKQDNMGRHHLESLSKLAKVNEPLYEAYLHKERFYEFFNYQPCEIKEAEQFLVHWIVDAFKVNLKAFKDFAIYLKNHTKILLNIIRTGRNSAISEGINTKITVIKRMAYGYRNIQYFMLKIMQRCGVLGQMWHPAPH